MIFRSNYVYTKILNFVRLGLFVFRINRAPVPPRDAVAAVKLIDIARCQGDAPLLPINNPPIWRLNSNVVELVAGCHGNA